MKLTALADPCKTVSENVHREKENTLTTVMRNILQRAGSQAPLTRQVSLGLTTEPQLGQTFY